ncbi:uncharacterized protein F4822DRAFT_250912 [Hypoxylon trugodes]|uniref:uncharacterized protein n=1 Tax=Hypoxylon trugodes TaxID=326681 RepID=UPI002196D78F|nr:uncharacterized protein F4822DRAFT_250912 [Hypoxylon trugodes]KAI1388585.1 hypothetical protein F4822DRAFT_250912 [Hypoxylon trugodes]
MTGVLKTATMLKPGQLFRTTQGFVSWSNSRKEGEKDHFMQTPMKNGDPGHIILTGNFARSEAKKGVNMIGN